MAIVIALIVLVVGSVLFHFLSPWNLTPLASNWGSIDNTIAITFVVTGLVFVAVNLFLAYAVFRYRYDKNRRAHYEPENKRLEAWLTGLTTVGIAALLAPGLFVWAAYVSAPEDAADVEVVGQQWHWSYRFPGEDGQLGAVATRFTDGDNPFGIDPDDPRGQDDVLVRSPELVLPVDRPVRLTLRSKDVLHNFQVAEFRAKMDLVPGQVSYIWLTPTRTGAFDILCAELCGVAHFAMRGRVRVVEDGEFEQWMAGQPTYAQLAGADAGDPLVGQGLYATCVACHGDQGQGNRDLNAPRIAGLPAWYLERQLTNFRTGVRGAHPEDVYGQQMKAFAGLLADPGAVAAVAAYVQTLDPERLVDETVFGNVERGAVIYRTCGACHGLDGQGVRAVNAPRLAGMNDWYQARQLANFRQGIRGRHAQDFYGAQMAELSQILIDEHAIDDVIAYINTLPPVPRLAAGPRLSAKE